MKSIFRREVVAAVLVPAIVLLVWEVSVRLGWVSSGFVSGPVEIFSQLLAMVKSGELWRHMKMSLMRIGVGYVIGVIPGIVIGAVMGFSKTVRAMLEPLVALIFPIPKIAILPLLLVFFGLGEASKIALIALGAIFLTLYNTMMGVRNLPPIYQEVAENFGATKLQYTFLVAIPGAIPSIITGMKLSLQTALLLIVSAEFVGAQDGIGFLIWSSWEILDVPRMFVGLLAICMMGYVVNLLAQFIEARYLSRYH